MSPIALDIELATLRTWPAREMELLNGWRLCAESGVTGRVNACWPLEWRGGDVDAAIDAVEAWYKARKLPPRFKLTDGAYAPDDLTIYLARRGYTQTMHTHVMTRQLPIAPPSTSSGERQPEPVEGGAGDIRLFKSMPPLFDRALKDSTSNPDDLEERRAIARRMPQPAAFAVRAAEDRPLAVGACACAGDLAGVFLMRTVPEARRQGHARHVLRALLDWARTQSASSAFLQVDADNAPAIALYEREGFAILTSYCFWRPKSN